MAGNENLQAHERTYFSMIALLKWGTLAVAVIVALVIWLIS